MKRLVVISGQSNGVGVARVADMEPSELVYADAYPAVQYACSIGNDANPPVTAEHAWGDLGPREAPNGFDTFGIELTMGRILNAAQPDQWAIAKFARSSTSLSGEWHPNSTFPNATSPPNLFEQLVAYCEAAEIATESELYALIWIQGEADAANSISANAYAANLLTLVSRFRQTFEDVPFIYGRLNANYTVGAFTSTIRAQQAAASANAGFHIVDQDPYELQVDNTHYSTTGYLGMGPAYAAKVLSLDAARGRRAYSPTSFVNPFLS